MRARPVGKRFFTDDFFSGFPPDVKWLFLGLVCMADREGRLENSPARILSTLYPGNEEMAGKDIKKMIGHLVALPPQEDFDYGFVIPYEANGKSYLQIVDFLNWTSPHHSEKPSIIPPPSGPCGKPLSKDNDSIVKDTAIYIIFSSNLELDNKQLDIKTSTRKTSNIAQSLVIEPLSKENDYPLAAYAMNNITYFTLQFPIKKGIAIIPGREVAYLQTLFPDIDVRDELKRLKRWNELYENRRKTKVGAKRHVTYWLTTAQRRAEMRKPETVEPKYPEPVQPPEDYIADHERTHGASKG